LPAAARSYPGVRENVDGDAYECPACLEGVSAIFPVSTAPGSDAPATAVCVDCWQRAKRGDESFWTWYWQEWPAQFEGHAHYSGGP
jgi:hypothetical protein